MERNFASLTDLSGGTAVINASRGGDSRFASITDRASITGGGAF